MTSTLIPWRLCTVESYRYQTIGIVRWSRYDRYFPFAMAMFRRDGAFDTSDGFRRVTAPAPSGFSRYVTPDEIDWTGLDEAIRKAA